VEHKLFPVVQGYPLLIFFITFLFCQCDHLINFSGADGLVKLWTVKTNECVATYDHHEDKVPVDP